MDDSYADHIETHADLSGDAMPTGETVIVITDEAVAQFEQLEEDEEEEWLKIQAAIQQQTQIMAEMSQTISTLSESLIQSQATAAGNYQTLVSQITEVSLQLTNKIAATDLTPPPESTPQAESPAASVVEELRETAAAEPVPTPAVPQKRKRF